MRNNANVYFVGIWLGLCFTFYSTGANARDDENPKPMEQAMPFLDCMEKALSPGRNDSVIAICNKDIKLFPKDAALYAARGQAFAKRGNLDRAIADFDQAIRLDPRFFGALNLRGQAFDKKGDYDHAIADFKQAIELAPDHELKFNANLRLASAYNNRGVAFGDNYNRALADFDEAIRLYPKNAVYHRNRCTLYSNMGIEIHARADCDCAIKIEAGGDCR